MKEIEYVEFDNKNYLIVSNLIVNGIKYVYMVNEDDPKDFYISKIKIKDGKDYYTNLDNAQEFDDILQKFYCKISNNKNC